MTVPVTAGSEGVGSVLVVAGEVDVLDPSEDVGPGGGGVGVGADGSVVGAGPVVGLVPDDAPGAVVVVVLVVVLVVVVGATVVVVGATVVVEPDDVAGEVDVDVPESDPAVGGDAGEVEVLSPEPDDDDGGGGVLLVSVGDTVAPALGAMRRVANPATVTDAMRRRQVIRRERSVDAMGAPGCLRCSPGRSSANGPPAR